ncbi:DNA-binding protein [Staphylococcus aureus]|nr:DNA-binding protein [Staphylococcus aureus]
MRNQIQKLLDSDLSSLQISKQTGVPQSTIHRMRKKGFFIFYGGKVKLPAFFNTQKAQLPL